VTEVWQEQCSSSLIRKPLDRLRGLPPRLLRSTDGGFTFTSLESLSAVGRRPGEAETGSILSENSSVPCEYGRCKLSPSTAEGFAEVDTGFRATHVARRSTTKDPSHTSSPRDSFRRAGGTRQDQSSPTRSDGSGCGPNNRNRIVVTSAASSGPQMAALVSRSSSTLVTRFLRCAHCLRSSGHPNVYVASGVSAQRWWSDFYNHAGQSLASVWRLTSASERPVPPAAVEPEL
jgi:hypothetical protein